MTTLGKIIVALTPLQAAEQRARSRSKAQAHARDCPWLNAVLQHHVAIVQALAAVRAFQDASARSAPQRWLATLLTGHAAAEEAVLYPALVRSGWGRQSTAACT